MPGDLDVGDLELGDRGDFLPVAFVSAMTSGSRATSV
jgi:hypothetical protein